MNRGAAVAASVLMATSVNLFLTPQNAEAGTYSPTLTQSEKSIYIMSNDVCIITAYNGPPLHPLVRPRDKHCDLPIKRPL